MKKKLGKQVESQGKRLQMRMAYLLCEEQFLSCFCKLLDSKPKFIRKEGLLVS